MNLYVGNLSYNTRESDIQAAFAAFGQVAEVRLVMDRETGRSKGFGFVEMPNDQQAKAAIQGLNGTDLQGRAVTVNEARPREERRPQGGGFGGGSRGGRW